MDGLKEARFSEIGNCWSAKIGPLFGFVNPTQNSMLRQFAVFFLNCNSISTISNGVLLKGSYYYIMTLLVKLSFHVYYHFDVHKMWAF